KLGVLLRLEDVLQHAELRLFLGLEVVSIVQQFAVAIAQDLGRVPPCYTKLTRLERRCKNGLEERLPGLEVLAADGRVHLLRKLTQRRNIDGQVRRAVGEGNALFQRSPRIQH